MGDRRRSRTAWGSWASGALVAGIVVAALLGIPATAEATSAAVPVQGTSAVVVRASHEVHRAPNAASNGATDRAGVLVAAGDPSSVASTQAVSKSGLVTRLGEARRANGILGQWVVAALLGLVIAMWVTLVAVVVRVRVRTARGAGTNAPGRWPPT